jgi:hypothetical protein
VPPVAPTIHVTSVACPTRCSSLSFSVPDGTPKKETGLQRF